MQTSIGTLYLLVGKIAAGKSTLAAELASAAGHVAIAEDRWLGALFGPEMVTVQDYVQSSARFRSAVAPHVEALLRAGVSVVLDFPANTVETRGWMRALIDATGCPHQMHFLDVPEDICKARLRARNAAGGHDFAATEAQFDQISRHFVPPTAGEGFNIIRHDLGPTP